MEESKKFDYVIFIASACFVGLILACVFTSCAEIPMASHPNAEHVNASQLLWFHGEAPVALGDRAIPVYGLSAPKKVGRK